MIYLQLRVVSSLACKFHRNTSIYVVTGCVRQVAVHASANIYVLENVVLKGM